MNFTYRNIVTLILVCMCATGALAQENSVEEIRIDVNVDAAKLTDALADILRLEGMAGNVKVGVTGPKDKVEEFRTLVEEVDVEPANVELTFYLVMASHESKKSSRYPPAIDSAINQIEKTFQYESFDLLDIIQLRAREGSHVEHSSGFPLSKVNTDEVTYDNPKIGIEVGKVSTSDQGGNDVFGFEVELSVGMTKAIVTSAPVNPNSGFQARGNISRTSVGARMNSSLDVREGQSVVLGKSNFDHSDDALFVIVQAKQVRDDRRPIN